MTCTKKGLNLTANDAVPLRFTQIAFDKYPFNYDIIEQPFINP